QIVAVDDRSTDRTPALLELLAAEAPPGTPVLVLHLAHLPPGWLGKTHALYQGARRASGEWILFTDADVIFGPDALSRAVRFAEQERLDHLVAFFGLDLRGFWENTFGLAFSLLFFLRFRPWHVRNARRREYLGVGGFNLLRRDAYNAIGTHRAIALEVADDMELGRRVKIAGLASDVVGAKDLVRVRWQEGLSGLMNGLTKNAYAGLHYSWRTVWESSALLLLTVVWPFAGLILARGRVARAAYGLCTTAITIIGAYHARTGNVPPLYSLTLPVSTLLLIVVMFRSALTTEHSGGITWRGTFYPLDELRARAIPPAPPLLG
ncbi:MAG: glycosyltransferase, partial [Cytophagales bacterium]|nr:glycosyltransferase [Armatimonadota bacterium]